MEENDTMRRPLLNEEETKEVPHGVEITQKNLHRAFKFNRSFSLFQFCCFLALLYSFCFQGYISYNLYLFELEPEYVCRFGLRDQSEGSQEAPFVPCNADELDKALEWKLDDSRNDLNLDNWYTRLDFQDVESWKIGMIGAIYFVGFIVGSTYFPRLADVYGRKIFVVVGGFLQSLSTLWLVYSHNFVLIYINMFLVGIASPFLASIGYNYILELIPESYENPVNTTIMVVDACGSLVGILYFTYISKDIDTFLIIVAVIGLVSSVLHCFTPESPIFLDQGVNEKSGATAEEISAAEDRKKTSILDFVTNKTLFINIFVMVCVWSTTSAGYYLINFNMKYIGGSIISNIYANVASEIVASLVASVIYEYFGSKKSLTMFFFISGIAGAVGCFEFSSPRMITGLILTAKFGIAASYCVIYITTAKIFPSVYSATAFGICNIFARIITAITPIIVELPNPIPMLFLSVTCFLVCFSICFLDDTPKHEKKEIPYVEVQDE